MPRVDETELRRWRALPASQLISRMAIHAKPDPSFVPIKGKATERWHANIDGREYAFIADGPKFFDSRANAPICAERPQPSVHGILNSFAHMKSTNTLSFGDNWRLDGHRIENCPGAI